MIDKKYAVLIDADNIGSQYIKTVFDEMSNKGIITIKRIYGDWLNPALSPWKQVNLEYSIIPVQQYSYTKGKNSTDSAMIIDAMDILYTADVDGFCLVSSDSDFTRLAARLREAGKDVVGMGKKTTPLSFIKACTDFKYIDILSEEENPVSEVVLVQTVGDQPVPKAKKTAPTQASVEDIKKAIRQIIEEHADAEGWVLASEIGDNLKKRFSDFDSRNYGFKKLKDMLESFKLELRVIQDLNNKSVPSSMVVSVRIPKKTKAIKKN